jgi:hypothetical protein
MNFRKIPTYSFAATISQFDLNGWQDKVGSLQWPQVNRSTPECLSFLQRNGRSIYDNPRQIRIKRSESDLSPLNIGFLHGTFQHFSKFVLSGDLWAIHGRHRPFMQSNSQSDQDKLRMPQ